jgi:hypothetical protein
MESVMEKPVIVDTPLAFTCEICHRPFTTAGRRCDACKPVTVGTPLADIKNHPNAFQIVDTDNPPAVLRWVIAYHTNSHSPRARKWYRVSRVVFTEGRCFELYWHPDQDFRGNDRSAIRKAAIAAGLEPMPGVYRGKRGGTINDMERAL